MTQNENDASYARFHISDGNGDLSVICKSDGESCDKGGSML